MSRRKTAEPQYDIVFNVLEKHGRASFGLMANESWSQDPKRTLFTLARYKFVAKMVSGRQNVLEIGCADAFATRIVQQHVENVTAVDFDPVFIDDVKERMDPNWPLTAFVHDILDKPVDGMFDAAYCLDVLEHIHPTDEHRFLQNAKNSLAPNSIFIVGAPSLESQEYASPQSKIGHINCKNGENLQSLLLEYFDYAFLFSMNDEVVHTGFSKMAHYVIVVAANPKQG